MSTQISAVEENELGLACVALRPGQHGEDQPFHAKRKLVALERRGYATYSEARGWRLTDLGKKKRAWTLKQGPKVKP